MGTADALKAWLQSKCPTFWSILNKKAQYNLPPGIVEYLSPMSPSEQQQRADAYIALLINEPFDSVESPSEQKELSKKYREPVIAHIKKLSENGAESGRQNLQVFEKHLLRLVSFYGLKEVGDAYRRDLSGLGTATQLAQYLCEITLAASLTTLSQTLCLRPPSGKGTFCDVRFQLAGHTVYGEAKRYEDTWALDWGKPPMRSLVKAAPGTKPQESAHPHFMDLVSKLCEVPRQFPDGTLNLVFVFHRSAIGEDQRYLQQALFGESTFFDKPDDVTLKEDGLFATKEWRAISACCLSKVLADGTLVCRVVWGNPHPRALVPVPKAVRAALDRLKPQVLS
ncbi:MAG: hypothetical protein V3S39_07650 [Thermodesulfobacteriota bacterium]